MDTSSLGPASMLGGKDERPPGENKKSLERKEHTAEREKEWQRGDRSVGLSEEKKWKRSRWSSGSSLGNRACCNTWKE